MMIGTGSYWKSNTLMTLLWETEKRRKKMTRFGKTLEQAGIMQRWVADKTGITPVAINHYVHGKRTPSVMNAIKIAKALGMKVEDLWGESDEIDRC